MPSSRRGPTPSLAGGVGMFCQQRLEDLVASLIFVISL